MDGSLSKYNICMYHTDKGKNTTLMHVIVLMKCSYICSFSYLDQVWLYTCVYFWALIYVMNVSLKAEKHINWNSFCTPNLWSKVLRSPPWHGWPLWNICVTNDHGYIPLVVSTSRSFPHSWLITRFRTRLTRRVPLVEQELPTHPRHLSSPPVLSGVRVTRSLVFCVMFCRSLFVFLYFFFWPLCYLFWFWLHLWYLQTLLMNVAIFKLEL
jgi:hypothetical protein